MESTRPKYLSQNQSTARAGTSASQCPSEEQSDEKTREIPSTSTETFKNIRTRNISLSTDKIKSLNNAQAQDVFKTIFKDGRTEGLTADDISAPDKPKWFQSRLVWKAICLFDESLKKAFKKKDNNEINLAEVLNSAAANDPFLNLITKRTILLALTLSGDKSVLDKKEKAISLLWLRYTFASEGFDISQEWLDRWLLGEDTPVDSERTLLFKFSNNEVCSSTFKEAEVLKMGFNNEDLFLNIKPGSLIQSLWQVLYDLTYYLRDCKKKNIKPLSHEGCSQHREFYIIKDILIRFFSGDVQTCMDKTTRSGVSYDESAWHRFHMEVLLDKIAAQHYSNFKEWRSWLHQRSTLPS